MACSGQNAKKPQHPYAGASRIGVTGKLRCVLCTKHAIAIPRCSRNVGKRAYARPKDRHNWPAGRLERTLREPLAMDAVAAEAGVG